MLGTVFCGPKLPLLFKKQALWESYIPGKLLIVMESSGWRSRWGQTAARADAASEMLESSVLGGWVEKKRIGGKALLYL